MNEKELIELFKTGKYYYTLPGLLISADVEKVYKDSHGNIEVEFEGGEVTIDIKKITKIMRPATVISRFEWCYLIKNSDGILIGYVGKRIPW